MDENLIQPDESIARTIYNVATPTMVHMFLETSYHIVDAIWIGMLGSIALAAVASASFLLWMVFSACGLVEIGVNSLIARYYGAKDFKTLNETAIQGIRFGIFITAIISTIGLLGMSYVFKTMELAPEVVDNAIIFLSPFFAGLPIFTITIICYSIFRGMGDTATPLKILSSTLLLNAVLAPLMIFGIGIFPEFGIAGGAFATIISQTIAAFFNIRILKRRKLLSKTDGKFINIKILRKISYIGSPIAFNSVIFCVVYIFITKVISQFGTAPVAALGIGHRVESIAFCISIGFSIAATTLVGQNIGAKKPHRANQIAWLIAFYAGGTMLVVSVLLFIFKERIAGIFSSDPEVISAAAGYLKVIAYTEVFLAFEIVMEGAFSGIGNTLPTTAVGLPINILRIPFAWYLSSIYGIDGIWWTIGISTVIKGFLIVLWFKIATTRKLKSLEVSA